MIWTAHSSTYIVAEVVHRSRIVPDELTKSIHFSNLLRKKYIIVNVK
jgi:hypothetical protein